MPINHKTCECFLGVRFAPAHTLIPWWDEMSLGSLYFYEEGNPGTHDLVILSHMLHGRTRSLAQAVHDEVTHIVLYLSCWH